MTSVFGHAGDPRPRGFTLIDKVTDNLAMVSAPFPVIVAVTIGC